VFWADNTWAKCACERMENGRDFGMCAGVVVAFVWVLFSNW
jgi:hypothetical protein